jgi:alanine racemase
VTVTPSPATPPGLPVPPLGLPPLPPAPAGRPAATGAHAGRWAWAEVDLDAVAHNVRLLRERVAPAVVWAVVKADGYGHGAVPVALAAMHGGAEGLCVALASEGVLLRTAGISAPILVLSQQPVDEIPGLVAGRLIPTLYDRAAVDAVADAARAAGAAGYPVHVKVDTGMHRVGCRPEDLLDVLGAVAAQAPALRLAGVWTHHACADDPAHPANDLQRRRFAAVLEELDRRGLRPPLVHAANSATGLATPEARHDMVRAGITIYGMEPGPGVAHLCDGLRPALGLRARVSAVRRVAAGEGVSYGWRSVLAADTTVATVPIGYADGVTRRYGLVGGSVLVGGRRRAVLGVVTMDQLMVDVGDDHVAVGDEVVLIGRQGGEEIRAEEWAERLGTIPYEVTCGLSARVPRRHTGGA